MSNLHDTGNRRTELEADLSDLAERREDLMWNGSLSDAVWRDRVACIEEQIAEVKAALRNWDLP